MIQVTTLDQFLSFYQFSLSLKDRQEQMQKWSHALSQESKKESSLPDERDAQKKVYDTEFKSWLSKRLKQYPREAHVSHTVLRSKKRKRKKDAPQVTVTVDEDLQLQLSQEPDEKKALTEELPCPLYRYRCPVKIYPLPKLEELKFELLGELYALDSILLEFEHCKEAIEVATLEFMTERKKVKETNEEETTSTSLQEKTHQVARLFSIKAGIMTQAAQVASVVTSMTHRLLFHFIECSEAMEASLQTQLKLLHETIIVSFCSKTETQCLALLFSVISQAHALLRLLSSFSHSLSIYIVSSVPPSTFTEEHARALVQLFTFTLFHFQVEGVHPTDSLSDALFQPFLEPAHPQPIPSILQAFRSCLSKRNISLFKAALVPEDCISVFQSNKLFLLFYSGVSITQTPLLFIEPDS